MSHQGSVSDRAILKKVNQHLARMSLGAHCRVNAAIHNGQVILSGTLQYENQRRPALKAARSVEGVRAVLDQLQVQPRKAYGPPATPHAIRQDSSPTEPPAQADPEPSVESQTLTLAKRSPAVDNPEANGPVPLTGASPPAAEPQPLKPPQPGQVEVDDSQATACYTNFCRVTGTPEELIIDFGVNPQPFGVPTEPIAITQRIVTNPYTAKRLLHVLQMTIQRHEATFGAIETDVQKRAQHR